MLVKVEHASLSIRGTVIFEDISAEFPSRKISAVVGPSGSGKSSLLAAISGHRKLTGGKVTFKAEEHLDSGPHRNVKIGWVAQGSNSLPRRSAIDNVMIALLARGEGVRAAREQSAAKLRLVHLEHRADTLARNLSGGELQRLSIARALAMQSSILLADEPTANLDKANAHLMTRILAEIETPCTILIATHDRDVEDVADYCLRLR